MCDALRLHWKGTSDKNKKENTYRGSATIEASVIVPFIIVVFVMIIQVCFFLYDECSVWQCCYIAALRADTVTGEDGRKEELTAHFIRELLQQELMAVSKMEITEAGIERRAGSDKLIVAVKGNVLTGATEGMEEEKWHFEAKGTENMLRPVQFIRRLRISEKWKEISDKKTGATVTQTTEEAERGNGSS